MGIQQWVLRQAEDKPASLLPLSESSLDSDNSVVEPEVSPQNAAVIEQQGFGVEHSATEQNLESMAASEASEKLELVPKAMPAAEAPKAVDDLKLKPAPSVAVPSPMAMPAATAQPSLVNDRASAHERGSRDPIESLDWQGLQKLGVQANCMNQCYQQWGLIVRRFIPLVYLSARRRTI